MPQLEKVLFRWRRSMRRDYMVNYLVENRAMLWLQHVYFDAISPTTDVSLLKERRSSSSKQPGSVPYSDLTQYNIYRRNGPESNEWERLMNMRVQ